MSPRKVAIIWFFSVLLATQGICLPAPPGGGSAAISGSTLTPTFEATSSFDKSVALKALIAVKSGRLTLQVEKLPLEAVLNEISQQSGIAILFQGQSLLQETLTLQLQDIPIEEGLAIMLKDYDTFFFYGRVPLSQNRTATPKPLLKTIWVYPGGQGEGMAPVPPEFWASSSEIEKGLSHPEPAQRAHAVETLVARKGEGALNMVRSALSDPEDQVRERALQAFLDGGVTLPRALIEELAQRDPSPVVRFLALREIGSIPPDTFASGIDLKMLVERASGDPNPLVKREAEVILHQMKEDQNSELKEPPFSGQTKVRDAERAFSATASEADSPMNTLAP